LQCNENKLTTLNLSGNEKLETLDCGENSLKQLNVSKNKNLKELNCNDLNLKKLDISHNSALEHLNCAGNRLTDLDVSKLAQLTDLNCGNNQLAALNLTSNPALSRLGLYGNDFSACEIDHIFRQLPALNSDLGSVCLKYGEMSLPGADRCREYIATTKQWQVISIFLEPCTDESHGDHHFHEIPSEINNTGNYECDE
jgi:hypothetical protein